MNFGEFFKAATDNEPYDYQCRLAGGDSGCRCESRLINIPTGLGKTAAVVLAWLWNRLAPSLNPSSSVVLLAKEDQPPVLHSASLTSEALLEKEVDEGG